jgi:hypothetical protein
MTTGLSNNCFADLIELKSIAFYVFFPKTRTSLQLQVYYVVPQLVIQNFQYKMQLEVLLE